MAGGEDPGGSGDPHILRMDGEAFDFDGVPHALHRLYECGGLSILPRIIPIGGDGPDASRSYFGGVDIHIDGKAKLVILSDGKAHILMDGFHWQVETKACSLDAPGHNGCTQDEPHPLQGVAHLNVTCMAYPEDRPGESGLMVDGDAGSDPAGYAVPG